MLWFDGDDASKFFVYRYILVENVIYNADLSSIETWVLQGSLSGSPAKLIPKILQTHVFLDIDPACLREEARKSKSEANSI